MLANLNELATEVGVLQSLPFVKDHAGQAYSLPKFCSFLQITRMSDSLIAHGGKLTTSFRFALLTTCVMSETTGMLTRLLKDYCDGHLSAEQFMNLLALEIFCEQGVDRSNPPRKGKPDQS